MTSPGNQWLTCCYGCAMRTLELTGYHTGAYDAETLAQITCIHPSCQGHTALVGVGINPVKKNKKVLSCLWITWKKLGKLSKLLLLLQPWRNDIHQIWWWIKVNPLVWENGTPWSCKSSVNSKGHTRTILGVSCGTLEKIHYYPRSNSRSLSIMKIENVTTSVCRHTICLQTFQSSYYFQLLECCLLLPWLCLWWFETLYTRFSYHAYHAML